MAPAREGISNGVQFGSTSLVDRTTPRLKSSVRVFFLTLTPASFEIQCKKGSDNARLLFRTKSECRQFVESCRENGFRHTTDHSLAVRKSAEVFCSSSQAVRHTSDGEALGPPLEGGATQVTTAHFQHTAGISVAPVVDRKSARVRIADWMSGFKMPIFKMVMEHGVHVF